MTYENTNCVGTRLSLYSNNFCVSNSRRSEKYLGRLRTARTAPVWHWPHTDSSTVRFGKAPDNQNSASVALAAHSSTVRCCCQMSKLTHFSNSSTVAHFKTNLWCVKRLPVQNLTINLGSRARFVACGQTDRQADRQTDRHVAASNTGHNAQPDNPYGALRSLSIDTHVSPQTLLNRFTRNFIYRKSSVT
jgi:hypothetical protein